MGLYTNDINERLQVVVSTYTYSLVTWSNGLITINRKCRETLLAIIIGRQNSKETSSLSAPGYYHSHGKW